MMRLSDVITDYTDGIFSAMGDISGVTLPWASDITNTILDSIYHGSVSANKRISPIVCNMLRKDNATTLSDARISELATMIYSINIDKWTKLYSTLSYQYDPLKNYDMTESETTSGTNSGSRSNTGTQTETHTGTVGNSETTSVNGTSSGTSADDIFAFNSSTASHADAGTTSGTTSNSGTASSTRTDNLTDQRTDALAETTSGTNSGSRSLTRSGNIGVTTSQQMIQSERDLDMWNIFYSVIFKDVDKMLTIATY